MLTEVASSARPKLLQDAAVWLFFERSSGSEDTYIVGSITADRFLTVPESKVPAIRAFMDRLDGTRTLEQVGKELADDYGLRINVEALHRKFQRAGLLSDGGGPRAGDIERMSATIMRFPLNGMLRLARRLSPLVTPMAYAGLVMILAALVWFAFDPVFRMPLSKSAPVGMLAGMAVLSVIVHELSHCLVAARWGILTGTLRIQLYLGIFPIVGLKFAGLYTLPPRGRLAVWSAGVFTNLWITAVSLIAMRIMWPQSAVLEAAVAVNWLMTLFNLMPLLPTDGYFLLTTLTKDPNVRVRAWDWLRRPFHRDRRRPSWFVAIYVVATIWLLLTTLWNHLRRVVDIADRLPLWQSLVSLMLATVLLLALWRTFRRKEDLD